MGLIFLWLSGILLILLGFLAYYLLTGDTPIDFWQALEGTIEGTVLTILFASVIVVAMLTIAFWIIKRPLR